MKKRKKTKAQVIKQILSALGHGICVNPGNFRNCVFKKRVLDLVNDPEAFWDED
jgi:hypothetical protein